VNSRTGSAHQEGPRAAGRDRLGEPGAGGAVRVALALAVAAVLLVTAACSSKQANRQAEQNAKLWGTATCSIAEAKTAQDQQNAYGQTKSYSAQAVQMVPSMDTGSKQIQGLVDTLNADKTANSVAKYVPDLNAIQAQAENLAKGSSGDEQDSWNSLAGSVSDCVAQLPSSLQG
jgi:hypothetical protein